MTAPRLTIRLYVSRPRLIERPYAGLARNLTLYFLLDVTVSVFFLELAIPTRDETPSPAVTC